MTTIGPLLAATFVTGDLDRACAAYRTGLGLECVANGLVGDQLASLWQTPDLSAARWSLLAPDDSGVGGIRLVEVSGELPGVPPLATLGWAAAELSVREPERLQPSLEQAGFRILAPARPLGSNPAIRAMQVAGPNGEVLYLADVRAYDGPMNLHRAERSVDRLFIAVLACRDLVNARGFYEDRFAAKRVSDRAVGVPVLGNSLNLPDDTKFRISSVQMSGNCLIEHDEYPPVTPLRPTAGGLPCGMAMITARADRVDGPTIDMPPYNGAPVQLVHGNEGEWVELVEASP